MNIEIDEKILSFICDLQCDKATIAYSFGNITGIPFYTFSIPDLSFHTTILAGKDFTWEHFRNCFDPFLRIEKTNFTEKQIKFLEEKGFIVGDLKLKRDSVMSLIEETDECIENANTRILEVLQDKSIPLEIRWELFEKWPIEWGTQARGMIQYESFDPELGEYDLFEIVDPTTFFEEDESEEFSSSKEEILEKGYRSFIFR